MRGDRNRLILAALLALAAGTFVYLVNPTHRIRADLRADAQGFVLSFEYASRLVEG